MRRLKLQASDGVQHIALARGRTRAYPCVRQLEDPFGLIGKCRVRSMPKYGAPCTCQGLSPSSTHELSSSTVSNRNAGHSWPMGV